MGGDHVIFVVLYELFLIFYLEILQHLVGAPDFVQDVGHLHLVIKFVTGLLQNSRPPEAEHITEAEVDRAANCLQNGVDHQEET